EDRPNSLVVFWSFRIMVGLGVLMLLLALWGVWVRIRGSFYESRALHRFALIMGPTGYIAMLAVWFTSVVSRQSWVVYDIMRTKDALSPVSAEQVGLTLIIFVVVYCVVFGIGIYYMLRLMHKGPDFIHTRPDHESDSDVVQASRRPLSSIRERIEEVPEQPDQEDKK